MIAVECAGQRIAPAARRRRDDIIGHTLDAARGSVIGSADDASVMRTAAADGGYHRHWRLL